MSNLKKKLNHWIDEVAGLDVNEYIKNGRKLLKKEHVQLIWQASHFQSLTQFLNMLEFMIHKFQTEEKWLEFVKTPIGFKFFETLISITPTRIRPTFEKRLLINLK